MCGIAGWIANDGTPLPVEVGRRMSQSIRHRGPDDDGLVTINDNQIWRKESMPAEAAILLAHRRLAILDLSADGHQPMSTADDRYILIFNGEIYNYIELRRELEKEGRTFHTQTDTEVLLQAMIHWGVDAIARFVGMFAFVFVDRTSGYAIFARDFFGIKPLYIADTSKRLAFASEIKALLELPEITRSSNANVVMGYLLNGTDNVDNASFIDGVEQLPPAHYLKVDLQRPEKRELQRYWKLNPQRNQKISFPDACDEVRRLFLDNVRLHLRSDVSVGAALSGGIDSSSIVCCMREIDADLDFNSISYLADDEAVSEERWVRNVVRSTGSHLVGVRISPHELVEDLDQLIYCQDEPFGSTSIYAQHRVFRAAGEAKIKVMLDGQGADEMLAGYHLVYTVAAMSAMKRIQPKKAMTFLRLAHGSAFRGALSVGHLALYEVFQRMVASGLRRPSFIPRKSGVLNNEWLRRISLPIRPLRQLSNMHEYLKAQLTETSLPSLLRYEDRNSMAHSIESRVPFLTPSLAEFLLSLPADYLLDSTGLTKAVFRGAMRGIVTDPILDRRDKIGFATPEFKWLSTLRPWIETTLADISSVDFPMFNIDKLREEAGDILDGRKPFNWRLWRWLNFIAWTRIFGVHHSIG